MGKVSKSDSECLKPSSKPLLNWTQGLWCIMNVQLVKFHRKLCSHGMGSM